MVIKLEVEILTVMRQGVYINAERRRQLQSPLCLDDGLAGSVDFFSTDDDLSRGVSVRGRMSSTEFLRMPRLTDLSAKIG